MATDFTYTLHCSQCGLKGEIEEFATVYPCPDCGGEMWLIREIQKFGIRIQLELQQA